MKRSQFTRPYLIPAIFLSVVAVAPAAPDPIDRQALVSRHDVHVSAVDPLCPLTVGNGNFAFTADVTGLQTFEDHYHANGIPLETLSAWGWHSFPNPEGLTLQDAMKVYKVHGRDIAYASLQSSPAGQYFRMSPHRMALGQLGLHLLTKAAQPVTPGDLKGIDQVLHLWTGLATSRFTVDDVPVQVETVCHPERDLIAVRITSSLLGERLAPRLQFPYAHDTGAKCKPRLDWTGPERHRTERRDLGAGRVRLDRSLDDTRYHVHIAWKGDAELRERGPHDFLLAPGEGEQLALVCSFAAEADPDALPSFEEVRAASAKAWPRFWRSGGAVDLSGSTDARAHELERRIVQSQYLTRVHYAGSTPPQESGLAHNSWYGKHHTEMIWWHAAHFALWGRPEYLEQHLAWYREMLPKGQALARAQGYEGVKWPKMTGPDGRPSPGTINPFIIWNQPHSIYLPELIYRIRPTRETLERYRVLVFESAEYLASYAFYNEEEDRYTLGPPIKSAGEDLGENLTRNPTFELAYWHYGLTLAQTWRERLGLPRDEKWDAVLSKLSALPVKDGLYLDIETDPDHFDQRSTSSHMLMVLGVLPGGPWVDRETVERTYRRVIEINGIDSFDSWGSGKVAMTAARLGDAETAVQILSSTAGACGYLPGGYVRRPKDPKGCPAYLPVNCSLLSAVALMAAGWDGAPEVNAPGFPQDGTWTVRSEGLQRMP